VNAEDMMIELKPEQQKILEKAMSSGMTQEEVVEQAFALVEEQDQSLNWMLEDREAIAAQIEEGFQQAERGELIDPEEAIRTLRARRANRQVA
jgi:predicted transcriptional regulator